MLDWNELIVSSCSAGSRHDIVLLFFLIYCNSLHFSVSLSLSLLFFFPSLSLHVLLTLASISSLPLCWLSLLVFIVCIILNMDVPIDLKLSFTLSEFASIFLCLTASGGRWAAMYA